MIAHIVATGERATSRFRLLDDDPVEPRVRLRVRELRIHVPEGVDEDALRECSTKHAPWYVVPADKKWFRNWVVSDVLVRTLKGLKMQYPPPAPGLDRIVIE